ncbi:chemotaxis protein CheB, partial [Salmonella enterica]
NVELAELERRIAGLSLVDEHVPAEDNGAVVVLAGIGGPDAVRQLLGALPAGFPRPVLVRQRLDGGRYDKLVAQMQRVSAMPV